MRWMLPYILNAGPLIPIILTYKVLADGRAGGNAAVRSLAAICHVDPFEDPTTMFKVNEMQNHFAYLGFTDVLMRQSW